MNVSIVSLIYKSALYADSVYQSVMSNTPLLKRKGYEFFFVANDATDKLRQHLVEKQYPHYVHYNQKRTNEELFRIGIGKPNYLHGVYCAWNKAIDLARGNIVVLINSDMIFSYNWLENLLKYSDNNFVSSQLVQRLHPKMGRIFKGAIHKEFGDSPRTFKTNTFSKFADRMSRQNKNVTTFGGAYMPCAVKKEFLIKVGKYPEGNLAGSSFDIVKEYGDRNLIRKLRDIGIYHITACDSIVYHFKEGEMDDIE